MDKSIFLALGTLFLWGFGNFVAKIASGLIGTRAAIWDRVGSIVVVILLTFFLSQKNTPGPTSVKGALLGLSVGLITGTGTFLFYRLLTYKQASWVVPITSVYPIVTIVLALLFLHEKMDLRQMFGVVLGMISVYLLSGV
jgi:transporter family protein